MRDKEGNYLTTKEFFHRWKKGIESVTALQQTKINLFGSFLMFVGVLIGLYSTFITKTWWLFIILCGSFFLISMGLLGTLQKYWALKRVYDIQEEENNSPHQSGEVKKTGESLSSYGDEDKRDLARDVGIVNTISYLNKNQQEV